MNNKNKGFVLIELVINMIFSVVILSGILFVSISISREVHSLNYTIEELSSITNSYKYISQDATRDSYVFDDNKELNGNELTLNDNLYTIDDSGITRDDGSNNIKLSTRPANMAIDESGKQKLTVNIDNNNFDNISFYFYIGG